MSKKRVSPVDVYNALTGAWLTAYMATDRLRQDLANPVKEIETPYGKQTMDLTAEIKGKIEAVISGLSASNEKELEQYRQTDTAWFVLDGKDLTADADLLKGKLTESEYKDLVARYKESNYTMLSRIQESARSHDVDIGTKGKIQATADRLEVLKQNIKFAFCRLKEVMYTGKDKELMDYLNFYASKTAEQTW